jgi:hypothetical protein
VPANASNLVVSEFSYNPAGPQNAGETKYSSSAFEFIELQNISNSNVDLFNVVLSGAADLVLATSVQQSVIPPGGRLVLAANPAALAQRHGPLTPVLGPYDGSLDNTVETIRLTGADGSIIKEFTYSDRDPWPEAADGEGYSLVLINPTANPDHTQAAQWRSSAIPHGQPGQPKGTTYAAWKSAAGITADDDDTDRDGLTAFAEYGLGSSPTVANFQNQPTTATDSFLIGQVSGEYLTIRFHRRLAADDVVYDIESSPALAATSWTPGAGVLVSEINNGDGTATMVFRSAQPVTAGQQVFLRLKLSGR